jgi:protein-histidine pros-kinase
MPTADLAIRTDRRALSQILLNLTNNAIKFTQQGRVCLTLNQRRIDGQVLTEMEVMDTGIGIRPADQTNLFQAFIRSMPPPSDGTRARDWVSIWARMADLLGGHITLQSEYGKGARSPWC